MKRKSKFSALAGILCGISLLAGCSCKNVVLTTGLNKDEIFKVSGSVCTKSEAMLLLVNESNRYNQSFGGEIWDKDLGGTTLNQYVKDKVKSELYQIKVIGLLAEEKSIRLTEEEKTKANEAGKTYFESLTDEEKSYMGVDEEKICSLYRQYALAEKTYTELTKNIDTKISDTEARVMRMQYVTMDNTKANKEKLKEIKEVAEAGGNDFATMAQKYTKADSVEIEVGMGEMPDGFDDAAFALEDGQISDVITTKDGYYLVKCIEDYCVEKTEKNKEDIINQRKSEAFNQIYDRFEQKLVMEFNDKEWDKIQVQNQEGIKTSNFIETYEKIFENADADDKG